MVKIVLKMNFIVIIFFLFSGRDVFTKSIQNVTEISNEFLQNRLDKMEASLSVLESTLNNISADKKEDAVMFFAIIKSRSFNLETESTVVFDTIVINEGSHYNNYDGVFVAPRDGIYLFSWTVSSSGASRVMTELVVEDEIITSTGERDADSVSYMSASMTAIYRMKKDGHAWIRTTGYGSPHYFYSEDNYPRTSFLGLLIRAE
ncbi:complement C1q tumor necrosis factor-related protein 2-like [Mytilus californianus]|uniref:complement C1q tumor necrosis factor-related protein 2-like n=1 Tax=Mytilus californianus TaxID=6549 RepID=UPI002245D35D|nr:complement C1q tumor necrosis factor-related protein 2-like [Mytilus californianus]